MTASGSTYYYLKDALGSIRQLIDSSETVQNSYDYYAFGRTYGTPTENVTQPFRFTGRAWDGESGLYYYRARYYDSTRGHFLARDPVGPLLRPLGNRPGGTSRADATSYAYVVNDPLDMTDPTGLWVCCREWKMVWEVNDYYDPWECAGAILKDLPYLRDYFEGGSAVRVILGEVPFAAADAGTEAAAAHGCDVVFRTGPRMTFTRATGGLRTAPHAMTLAHFAGLYYAVSKALNTYTERVARDCYKAGRIVAGRWRWRPWRGLRPGYLIKYTCEKGGVILRKRQRTYHRVPNRTEVHTIER